MAARKVTVQFKDNIAIVSMKGDKNMLNFDFLDDLGAALDEVISNRNAVAMITIGDGKFYSNGIDLAWMADKNEDIKTKFMHKLCNIIARILTFPLPTVAAVNGHAFAGGAFLALCHDYRVMNESRGWLSVNEVHLPSRIPFFLLDMAKCKLPNGHSRTEVISFGKRLTAQDCMKLGIVHAVGSPDSLIDKAIALVQPAIASGALDRDSLGWMKRDLYQKVLTRLDKEVMPHPISKL